MIKGKKIVYLIILSLIVTLTFIQKAICISCITQLNNLTIAQDTYNDCQAKAAKLVITTGDPTGSPSPVPCADVVPAGDALKCSSSNDTCEGMKICKLGGSSCFCGDVLCSELVDQGYPSPCNDGDIPQSFPHPRGGTISCCIPACTCDEQDIGVKRCNHTPEQVEICTQSEGNNCSWVASPDCVPNVEVCDEDTLTCQPVSSPSPTPTPTPTPTPEVSPTPTPITPCNATAPACDGDCPNAGETCQLDPNDGGNCLCVASMPCDQTAFPACFDADCPEGQACQSIGDTCQCENIPAAGFCGNGIVEPLNGEECDVGDINNGVVPIKCADDNNICDGIECLCVPIAVDPADDAVVNRCHFEDVGNSYECKGTAPNGAPCEPVFYYNTK